MKLDFAIIIPMANEQEDFGLGYWNIYTKNILKRGCIRLYGITSNGAYQEFENIEVVLLAKNLKVSKTVQKSILKKERSAL